MEASPDSVARTPHVPHRHLAGWTLATSVALGAIAFMLALLTESAISDARIQGDVRDQFFVAESDLTTIHARFVALTRGVLLLSLVAAVLWLAWQYQAHANLRALGSSRMHPLLALAIWLIPGLNVLLAWVGLGDLWMGSDPVRREGNAGRATFTPVLLLWWTAFTATVTLAVLALLRAPQSGAGATDLIARDHLLVAACVTGIADAVLGIVLLFKIEGRLDLKEDAAGHTSWKTWSDDRRAPGSAAPSPTASQRNIREP